MTRHWKKKQETIVSDQNSSRYMITTLPPYILKSMGKHSNDCVKIGPDRIEWLHKQKRNWKGTGHASASCLHSFDWCTWLGHMPYCRVGLVCVRTWKVQAECNHDITSLLGLQCPWCDLYADWLRWMSWMTCLSARPVSLVPRLLHRTLLQPSTHLLQALSRY